VSLVVNRSRHPSRNNFKLQRQFYRHTYPRHTHFDVQDDPNVSIRKFSPCGKYLITFSKSSSHYIQVYRLKRGFRQQETAVDPSVLWSHFFKLHFKSQLCRGANVSLNKDLCLFGKGSRFVIVASTSDPVEPSETDRGDDSVQSIRSLEDITIFVVDMQTGATCSEQLFPRDCIMLVYNAGVFLRGDLLAVFSSYYQKIHIFALRDNGELHPLQTIGSTCYPDDQLYLSQTRAECVQPVAGAVDIAAPTSLAQILQRETPAVEVIEEPEDNCIKGVKHRLLSFLWRRAWSSGARRMSDVRYFHHHFEEFRSLRIWKMQLLDDTHLLLKYGSEKYVESRSSDSMGVLVFFVVYNFITTEIVNVYENNSSELLSVYEQCTEFFFEDRNELIPFSLPLPSNSFYTRDSFRKQVYTARNARNGGQDQSIRRNLSDLPVGPQNIRESPYFDLDLFSYDEKLISPSERLKHCFEFPVKFYARHHGRVSFRIYTGKRKGHNTKAHKKLASFLFHPYLPFVLTIQHVIQQQPSSHSSHINIHTFS